MGDGTRVICVIYRLCGLVPNGKVGLRYFGLSLKVAGILEDGVSLDCLESRRGVHNVLYDPVLMEYLRDTEFEFSLELLTTEQDLTFKSRLMCVLDRSEIVLRYRCWYTFWCCGHIGLSEKRLGS